MTVRIVTYNILVPIYADEPEHYAKSQPQFLKTDYRWNLIQSQLEQEIVHHENTVICLQEVSLVMLPRLQLFFRRLNYSFFHNLYGGHWNDYMGVGMAIPVSMQLSGISYIKIGDHIRSICKLRENETKIEQDALRELIETAFDPWEQSMDRRNTLICLQLVIDGRSLFVGTYHMPCAYKEPSVMAIHSSIVKDLMFELAAGNDFVLAGDFNFEPRNACYRAFIEKGYRDVRFPKSKDYDVSYLPNTEQVLKSAYREKNLSEPVYTNFSDTPGSPDFCETLDYIFFTGQLTVEKVLELPDQPIGESYPDETHPSDHLMIAATFRLS
jgi:endonuclease/exonuclease/phosphatase family metal-dependent hydrolase